MKQIPKSKLERFAYDVVLGFVIGVLFIAITILLSGCTKRKDPPLRQWYPIDRCHDYANALEASSSSNLYAKCMGCVGTKCEVSTERGWSNAIDIHKLDCSGRICLSR